MVEEKIEGRVEKEMTQEEMDVVSKYQSKRRRAFGFFLPTVLAGLALFTYGRVQMYENSNPPLRSAVHQYKELIDESDDIGMDLKRLELLDKSDGDLGKSLESLIMQYKTRKETLENSILRAEESDEIKSYNNDSYFASLSNVGGMAIVALAMVVYSLNIISFDRERPELFRAKYKYYDT